MAVEGITAMKTRIFTAVFCKKNAIKNLTFYDDFKIIAVNDFIQQRLNI